MHRVWGVSLTALLFALAAPAAAQDPAPEAGAEAPAEPTATGDPAGADALGAAEAPAAIDAEAPPAMDAPATGAEAPPAAAAPEAAAAAKETTLGPVGWDEQGRQGRIHLVVPGDTLWDISEAYLGTPWVWPPIWKDNDDIANPHRIFPGDRIWITPWEMRRVSPEEAERMLAARPAEQAPEPEIASQPAPPALAVDERVFHRESAEETVGLVSEDVLEAAASIVSPVPKRVLLGSGDRVHVGLGREDVEPGDRFTIFRTREKVFDPETGRMLGWHVDLLGWLEVLEPADESSLAEIRLSAAEIEVGDRLMPRETPQYDIAIGPSPSGVEGRISFFPNSRTHMGSQDFVYLNRGADDGLAVGSPLEVYRAGFQAKETARDEKVRVPERVVAQLLVIRAQPNTAVAVVRHTEEELALGDRFRGATR
jgi:hypothetical protein